MGDSSYSERLPAINVPEVTRSGRNWSTLNDPFYMPLNASQLPSLHPESTLTSPTSPQGSNSSSNPQRAPISDDEKIELLRLQERVGNEEIQWGEPI